MSEDPEVVGSTPTADRPLAGATALDTRPQTISLLRRLVAVVDAATMVWRDPVPADAVPALHDAKVDLASLGVEPDLETERTR